MKVLVTGCAGYIGSKLVGAEDVVPLVAAQDGAEPEPAETEVHDLYEDFHPDVPIEAAAVRALVGVGDGRDRLEGLLVTTVTRATTPHITPPEKRTSGDWHLPAELELVEHKRANESGANPIA